MHGSRAIIVVPLMVFLFLPFSARAHVAEIDENCGHYDDRTWIYHYHKNWKTCGSPDLSIADLERSENAFSSRIKGTVVRVVDGDTVVVKPNDSTERFTCRLYAIDAPEVATRNKPAQPFGVKAAKFLERFVLNKPATVLMKGRETYRREVCAIELDGMNVNLEMVRSGHAWVLNRDFVDDRDVDEYAGAEKEARGAGRGLWSDPKALKPWEFRAKRR